MYGLLAGFVVGWFSHFHPLATPAAAFVGPALASLQWWRYWWQPAWVGALVILFVSGARGFHIAYLPLAAICGAALPYAEWWNTLQRFRQHTWKFNKSVGNQLIIRWSPELAGQVDLEDLIRSCDAAIPEFAQKFGFRLKRKVLVFLFARWVDIQMVLGKPVGGFAMTGGEAMILAPDVEGSLKEVFRHELTHLFSWYWSRTQQPFNHEGLATSLMETVEGKQIDYHALVHVLADAYFPMVMRVPSRFFSYAPNSNFYIAAGSFTGFLIRTFGWDVYAKFFRRAHEDNYEALFERDFGLGILAAERRWRVELLQGRKALEPALSGAVAEHRIQTAYNSWQFYRCLEEVERTGRTGPLSAKVTWFAMASHAILGHYSDAALLNKQLLEMNDPWVEKHRARLWLGLGNLYDLLGQRAEALEAYEKVIAQADSWMPNEGSTHALALGYQKEAFTETHLMHRYKSWTG
jgi:tetratricopeptide (TPR) repeat protein